jgi:hypothetical protein
MAKKKKKRPDGSNSAAQNHQRGEGSPGTQQVQ